MVLSDAPRLGGGMVQREVQRCLDEHDHDERYEPKNPNIQTHIAQAHAPADAQKNADITKAEIEAKLTGEVASHSHAAGGGEAFPVGSVFIAVVSTNPVTLLGYGTWSAFAAGRMLVGLDSGDTDFDAAEETGGAKTVTLTAAQSGLPQHTHTQNSHNHTQDAHTHTQNAHSHVLTELRDATTGAATTNIALTADTSSTLGTKTTGSTTATNQNATATNQSATATNQNAGPSSAAEAHSNMPPYIVVYMWKRTA